MDTGRVVGGAVDSASPLEVPAEVLMAVPGAPAELGRRLLANVSPLLAAGLTASVSGEYYSTHWLATFAWDAMESIDAAPEPAGRA